MSIIALKVPLVPRGSKHRGSVYAEVLGARLWATLGEPTFHFFCGAVMLDV